MLTDRFVRNAPTGTHTDEGGLYLRVLESGRKSWISRTQTGGKDRWKVIGAYPAMGLAEARQRVQDIRNGKVSITVSEAAKAFLLHVRAQYKDPEQVQRRFDVDILPTLEGYLSDVTRQDVSDLLQKIVDRGSPVAANRTLADIKNLFAFAFEKGWIDGNPITPLTRRAVGGKEKPKSRNLSLGEIKSALELNVTPSTGWCLYFILLTGCRPSEAIYAIRHRTVVLPPEAVKSDRPHSIPATAAVRAALKLAPPPPKDHRVLSHALRRLEQTFTPHDLRRTFASRLADEGVPPHVIEKLLNHQMEGVMAVYNRAEYWPERVAAQKLWGLRLKQIKKRPE